jgi:hypothetical protein
MRHGAGHKHVLGTHHDAPPLADPAQQIVSALKAGLTLQEQMDSFLEVAADCRTHGVKGRLRRLLKHQLHK